MSRLGRPVLSWQLGCKVPEKVPEKTPGAWLTKLSMMAPGLRERVEGLLPPLGLLGVLVLSGLLGVLLGVLLVLLLVLQLASGQRTGATGLAWPTSWLGWLEEGWW